MSDLIGKTLGPYRVLEQIGVGGMATVYKAYQPNMERYVAIKVLPHYLSQDKEFAKRFQREAHAIARLEHPHILPVFDYGEADDITYIAMRYIEAGTLKQHLQKGLLPLDDTVRLIGQIGSALDYAHRQGVVHRDVKPGNVLIDHEGNTYLTDFGLARMLEASEQLTASGVGLGTPAYMSPEQGQGIKADHRSDIYSLGVILFEMVTGRIPYEAETPMATVLKHINDPLPLPRTVNPNVPEPIERVILKALAKDPAHRYQTAGEMVQALNKAAQETGVSKTPSPPVMVEAAPAREEAPLAAQPQPIWQRPRGKAMLIGGAVIIILTLALLVSQLPGRMQIAAPGVATTTEPPTTSARATVEVATPTLTRLPATAAIVATTPPVASPIPAELTLTLRLRLSSTSDWAELALLSSAEIIEASTVESSSDATLAAMDIERRTIDLDQPFQAGEADKQVSMLLDLVLAGVSADGELRFKSDKGCLGVLKVEFFNLSVGEPVPIQEFVVESCNPPSPPTLAVPVGRLAEVKTFGPVPKVGGIVANWCDERWPGKLCLHDLETDEWNPITLPQNFQGDRGRVSWASGGERLEYSAARKAGDPQHLYWINADGTGGGQYLPDEIYGHDAAWSHGGELMIAFAGVSCDGLWLVRPDGSDLRQLWESPDYCEMSPAWSPDGRRIAFLLSAEGIITGIWVISTEGGQPQLVYDCGQTCGSAGDVAWSPDGRKLLYWHFREGVEQRLLLFADGSGIAGKIDGVPYWWQSNFWPPWGGQAQR